MKFTKIDRFTVLAIVAMAAVCIAEGYLGVTLYNSIMQYVKIKRALVFVGFSAGNIGLSLNSWLPRAILMYITFATLYPVSYVCDNKERF